MDGPDNSMDLELAAASLRADRSDVGILLHVLVDQLAEALGARLDVKRAGGRLKKSDRIEAITITLGGDQFGAVVEGTVLNCSIGHTSGGIRIRTEQVDMDTWLSRLLGELKAEAATSEAVRRALESIVIGGTS